MSWRSSIYLFILLLNSCEGIINLDLTGDGNLVESTRVVTAFKEIELIDDFVVNVTQSDADSWEVVVVGDANLIPYVVTENDNSRLIIRRRSNFNLYPVNTIHINISVPHIDKFENIGGGQVHITGFDMDKLQILNSANSFFKSDNVIIKNLKINSDGGANASVFGSFDEITVRQMGSGSILLKGNSNSLILIQEGSGIIDGLQLETLGSYVFLYGSGLVYCNVADQLNVTIDGTGRVFYKGNPELTSIIKGDGLLLRHH